MIMVHLDHETWTSCSAYFTAEAKIYRLDRSFDPVPIQIDVLVSGFTWPTPADGYSVWVKEPDPETLYAALKSMGLSLPVPLELLGLDLVPDKEISAFPGSVTPYGCPVCSSDDLVVGRSVDLRAYAETYARLHRRAFHWIDRGETPSAWIDDQAILLVQCTNCVERFLVGPATDGQLVPGPPSEGKSN